jgi:hypothetical protein
MDEDFGRGVTAQVVGSGRDALGGRFNRPERR